MISSLVTDANQDAILSRVARRSIVSGHAILQTKFLSHNSLSKALRANIKILFGSKYFSFSFKQLNASFKVRSYYVK